MTFKKYSTWQKVDLHIHTDWSTKTKDSDYKGTFDVDTLHKKMTNNEVTIFSLTDHNIINVDVYKSYYESYSDENNPLLLLGVELDINLERGNATESAYHSLLIFNYSDIENTTRIANKLEQFYNDAGINIKERVVTLEDIVTLFHKEDFFFIPHAHSGSRGIVKTFKDGESVDLVDAQKMLLLMQSPLEKVKEEAIHFYNAGFDMLLNDAFKHRNDIAYIQFSDNHNISAYPLTHKGEEGNSKTHEFYYLKGHKNYETLRLAFIDPESRIKTTKQFNSLNNSNSVIEFLKIQSNSRLEDITLEFSPHLNVVIGGRSSGKSLLMNLLGHKIDRVKNVQEKYKDIDLSNILIKSSNDAGYVQETSISDNIVFINQGEIVNYFEEDNLKDLANKSEKLELYNEKKQNFLLLKNDVDEKVQQLVNAYANVRDLDINKHYVLHQSTLNKILSESFIIKLDEEELFEKYDFSELFEEAELTIETLIENINKLRINTIFNLTNIEEEKIKEFEKLVELKRELVQKTKSNNEKQKIFLNKVKNIIDTASENLDNESQLKTNAISQKNSLITDIREQFMVAKELKDKSEAIESTSYNLEESFSLSEDVELVLKVNENIMIKDIITEMMIGSDTNKTVYQNLLLLVNEISKLKNYSNNETTSFEKKIRSLKKEIDKLLDEPKDYLKYQNGTSSKDNSPGYNSEQYLKIILNNDRNKIIIIDQPEDNLGNRFITTELVKEIRNIKFQKQLFLITHNPSIVVYGDAESIIIAHNDNNSIKYKQVVLEDKNAQKEICEILDGGEYIFDKRAKKYNIQRLIQEEE